MLDSTSEPTNGDLRRFINSHDLLGFRIEISPKSHEFVEMVGAQDRPISGEIVEVIHDDGNEQINDLGKLKERWTVIVIMRWKYFYGFWLKFLILFYLWINRRCPIFVGPVRCDALIRTNLCIASSISDEPVIIGISELLHFFIRYSIWYWLVVKTNLNFSILLHSSWSYLDDGLFQSTYIYWFCIDQIYHFLWSLLWSRKYWVEFRFNHPQKVPRLRFEGII